MKYMVESNKTVDTLLEDFQAAVKQNSFGVLNIHDLQQTLKNKGFELNNTCYVLDVCNPGQAKKVLDQDMQMNIALPCRVSIFQENGTSKVAMIKPTAMLAGLSDSAELMKIAEEVEAQIMKMIDEAI